LIVWCVKTCKGGGKSTALVVSGMTLNLIATQKKDARAMKAVPCETMQDVRENVDRLDRVLVGVLAERLGYIEQAARIKQSRDAVRDEDRIEDVIAKVKAQCKIDGLDENIAERLWRFMMEDYIAHEFVKWDDLRKNG
jgi:isochorismate pyruvate lyase